MNEEKKIAGAILDAQKMREESHVASVDEPYGHYQLEIEECLIATCKQRGLSPNLWALLNLAMHWWNDIQLWAEDILARRNVLDQMQTPDEIAAEMESKDEKSNQKRKSKTG